MKQRSQEQETKKVIMKLMSQKWNTTQRSWNKGAHCKRQKKIKNQGPKNKK
jgi:hypothetical protein